MENKAAIEALNRLMVGNYEYWEAREGTGDVSPELRQRLAQEGQKPCAVIITCSDSRVVPEHLFRCGLGDLFVIRVAGNVVEDSQAASAAYAVGHLGVPLVMVLGHTDCGAVGAALAQCDEDALQPVVSPICEAIGDERDPAQACLLNVESSVRALRTNPKLGPAEQAGDIMIVGAVYDIATGRVELDEELEAQLKGEV